MSQDTAGSDRRHFADASQEAEAEAAMAFKLTGSAQRCWRMAAAPHLVALVRAGASFVNGKLAGRPGEDAPPGAA